MHSNAEQASVRSVTRALNMLELIGTHQALGLEELHYLSRLPKATVSRLLLTLKNQGWVYRALSDKRYHLSANRLFGDPAQRDKRHLVELAAPQLLALSEHTELVVELSYFDGEHLEVMEAAIPKVLRKFYPRNRQFVGLHASLYHSAMGKACMAQLPVAQMQRLALRDQVPLEPLIQIAEKTLRQGYGQRCEGYRDASLQLPFLIRAVALPLKAQGKLAGSIALHWPTHLNTVQHVLDMHMASLELTVSGLQEMI